MEQNRENENVSRSSEKLPYSRPELIKHGRVETMTLGQIPVNTSRTIT